MFRSFWRRGPKPAKARLALECLETRLAPALYNTPILVANGVIDKPASASNAAGNRVVVWSQQNGAAGTDIFAQRYNNAGDKVGQAIRVTATTTNEIQPDVCITDAGNFFVTYTRDYLTSTHIEVARFTATGVLQERLLVPSTASFMNERDSHVACSGAGKLVLTYTQLTSFGEQDVIARMYTVVNNRFSQQRLIFVDNTVGEAAADSDVARRRTVPPAGTTSFVVTYVVDGDVLARRYDDNGNLLNPLNPELFIANRTFSETDPSISVSNNLNPRFVIAWQQKLSFFAGNDIAARTFDVNGTMGQIRNVQTSSLDDTAPEVVFRNNNTQFLVAYRSENTGFFTFQVNVTKVTETNPASLTATFQTQTVTAQSFTGQSPGFSTISLSNQGLTATVNDYLIAYSQPSPATFNLNLVSQRRRFV